MILNRFKVLNAFQLKLLAMLFMFCDHLWATAISGNMWLTNIGRLAFPIFAFQIAEGFSKTKNFKRYLGRVFLFALISEIPFNLMNTGGIFFPFHQNVMFSFVIALLLLRLMEWGKSKNKVMWLITIGISICLANVLGPILMVDFYNYGILMVIVFYLFREGRYAWIGQLAGMIYINVFMMGGMILNYNVFGLTISFPQQALAILSLIFIWMYNGEQGPNSRAVRLFSYSFYPLHILILSLITLYLM